MKSYSRALSTAALSGLLAMGYGTQSHAAEPTTTEPTTAELMEKIQQLQARVSEMQVKQEATNTAAVNDTVERVLRDADRRSQLMQLEGFTAGYNKGKFLIQDAAGNFVLNPYFQFQFRSVTNYIDDTSGPGDDDETENGFEIRRAKLGFKGNAFSPDFTYNFRWASERNGGDTLLELAYVQYAFADDLAVKAGQWKDNVYQEETVSSGKQLAVDRSMLNELLAGGRTDYVQGVSLLYIPKDGPFHGELALTDGLNTDNTNFQDHQGGSLGISPNWGAAGRAEYKVMGDWKSYEDFTAMHNKHDLLVVGGGFDYSEDGGAKALLHTVDVQWETSNGLGVYAAYIGASRDPGGDADSLYDWGGLVQAGYMINEKWEVFGRYDYTSLDDAALAVGAEDTFNELTVGVNHYFFGHNAKVTIDLTWLPDGAPSDISGIGVLQADDTEFVFRTQFQLLL